MAGIDRRRWERRPVMEPELGVVSRHGVEEVSKAEQTESHNPLFVGVHNISEGGMLLELSLIV